MLRLLLAEPSFSGILRSALPFRCDHFGGCDPEILTCNRQSLPDFQIFFHSDHSFHCVDITLTFSLPIVSVRYRHIRSTLRHNRFHRRRWDNYPISVSVAKTGVFVRDFTVTRERYTVTLNHKYRHPHFYRHPPQTKVNRRFLNFGCRYGQQFPPTAGFRFYCHPIHHKRVQVFVSHDFCAY